MSTTPSEYGNVMDILDIAKKYDLIEIKRGNLTEWAIYIGSADVAHFVNTGNWSLSCFLGSLQYVTKVEITTLRDLLSSDKCRINNQIESASRFSLKKLNEGDIAANIENSLNGDEFYDLFLEDIEYFVTAMKYGCENLRMAVESDEKINGLRNRSVENVIKKAKKFDLIQINRHTVFSHWAIYTESGNVIHFVNNAENDELQLNISNVSNGDTIKGIVQQKALRDVAGQDYCVINNLENLIAKRGLTPLSEEEMEQRLNESLKNELVYDLLEENCEHFVTRIKFGHAFSIQAEKAKTFMIPSMMSLMKKVKSIMGLNDKQKSESDTKQSEECDVLYSNGKVELK